MYPAVVAITMFIAPIGSVLLMRLHEPTSLAALIGKCFVFWAVGVRLGLAGIRQVVQPSFTAEQIFNVTDRTILPIVRELGIANLGLAVIALAAVAEPTFTLPAAIAGGIFYGAAGIQHLLSRHRTTNETVAMASDLFVCAVLATYVTVTFLAQLSHPQ